MDEKTAELRDIFTEVTDGDATVTESQEDTRGSLDPDQSSLEDRLRAVIERMRERYGIEGDVSDETLVEIATAFYDGMDDDAIAEALDLAEETVFEGRLSLHLLRPDEQEVLDRHRVRDLSADDETVAEAFDVDESQVPRIRRLAAARAESLGANDRYRDEFDSLLSESDLSSRMASDVREDGLEDATEGMETEVSF